GRVAMLDLDPQGTLGQWITLRGENLNPRLFRGVDDVSENLDLLRRDGWEWAFIDTPPALMEVIEAAVMVSDLAVIPVRASAFDIAAIDPVVEMVEAHGTPYAFLLNAAEPRWKLTKKALEFLERTGHVLPPISYQMAAIAALSSGKTGPEINSKL